MNLQFKESVKPKMVHMVPPNFINGLEAAFEAVANPNPRKRKNSWDSQEGDGDDGERDGTKAASGSGTSQGVQRAKRYILEKLYKLLEMTDTHIPVNGSHSNRTQRGSGALLVLTGYEPRMAHCAAERSPDRYPLAVAQRMGDRDEAREVPERESVAHGGVLEMTDTHIPVNGSHSNRTQRGSGALLVLTQVLRSSPEGLQFSIQDLLGSDALRFNSFGADEEEFEKYQSSQSHLEYLQKSLGPLNNEDDKFVFIVEGKDSPVLLAGGVVFGSLYKLLSPMMANRC
ncbi:hypothetical protein VOLCADRAFT_86427 [Volvox carteri f. nagariensis]|uniref:Uncharacterized protein n=1 Tax=Volvox carteri f. nagariensis TaxID=3068 RepID=D8TIR4_VOLCA|nr:uncharacterized protein VOLCADRAFT_86427 [Volvox carteri f. nagariensis]EFJ52934.1 hypothetical protein VOLCADRAFT_86427 [Volvox carteri f. nagariensis]|eukprot:XP_002945939.1 hypothetical protein VOLCADRAFT_86427 [Volvox carteri f. nagariensis]